MLGAAVEAARRDGFRMPTRGVLLSLGPVTEKYAFYEEARALVDELGLPIFATAGTADALEAVDIACTRLAKNPDEPGATAMDAIKRGLVDLVIHIPREFDEAGRPDGFLIRRAAVDTHVPLFTELKLARAVVAALRARRVRGATERGRIDAWDRYVRPG